MGGCFSKKDYEAHPPGGAGGGLRERRTKNYHKPVWRSQEPLNQEKLTRMREEFWDTQPSYGGDKNIWDALKAACEADMATARLIIDSAGIIIAAEDMTVCYDERGAKYELPTYVLSDPSNLEA